jgi:hypothetical protein
MMVRVAALCFSVLALVVATLPPASANELSGLSGDYMETRTCDIYTGPCFANAQVGLTGEDAILAWSVTAGEVAGIDLAGLKVVAVVHAADTLGFGGGLVVRPDPIRSVILVDDQASPEQREALIDFVKTQAGRVLGEVVRVEPVKIDMATDHVEMVGTLKAGNIAELTTRKMGQSDCVCTNETVFYPPLAQVENSEPAYTVDGGFSGRGLGTKWTNPRTRSSFLATFGN